MKYLIRVFLFNVFALWLTSELIGGLVITGGWQLILSAGLVLSLLMLIVKPALKILFIPINILTFGLLSWFINVIVIFILTYLIPDVSVKAFTFSGFSAWGFVVPHLYFTYPVSLVIVSLTITLIGNILHDISQG